MKMQLDLRDCLRMLANRADPIGNSKGTDADVMRQAADQLDRLAKRVEELEFALSAANAERQQARPAVARDRE